MTWQKILFLFAVPYAVNRCNQNSVSVAANQAIARLSLARKNELGNIVSDNPVSYCLRFFTAASVLPAGLGTSRSGKTVSQVPGEYQGYQDRHR